MFGSVCFNLQIIVKSKMYLEPFTVIIIRGCLIIVEPGNDIVFLNDLLQFIKVRLCQGQSDMIGALTLRKVLPALGPETDITVVFPVFLAYKEEIIIVSS